MSASVIIEEVNTLDAPQIKIRLIGDVWGIPVRAEALALDVEQRLAAAAGIVAWVPLTPEALVFADPDVDLVMDRGLAVVGGVEGLLQIPGIAETKAGRGPYIISMPDLYLRSIQAEYA